MMAISQADAESNDGLFQCFPVRSRPWEFVYDETGSIDRVGF